MARHRYTRFATEASRAVAAALFCLLAVCQPVAAQEAPTTFYIEGGLDRSHFTDDFGNGNSNGNGQWLVFILSQPANYSLRFDVSRAQRWEDEGYGGGLLAQKFIGQLTLGAGVSGGKADFIYPEYRLDASIGYGFLAEANLKVTLGYLHEQSQDEPSYDRGSISANYYMNSHWIFGGFFNYDVGQPGDTITKSIGLGATWFKWQKRYIGGLASYGDVNYTQVGEVDFLVDYENFSLRFNYSEYFNPTFGANIRFDYGTNEFFDVYGVSVSVFKSW